MICMCCDYVMYVFDAIFILGYVCMNECYVFMYVCLCAMLCYVMCLWYVCMYVNMYALRMLCWICAYAL